MTRSAARTFRDAAEPLGFWLESLRRYVRRPPGTQVNEVWFEAALLCPCGTTKALHVRRESLPGLQVSLRDHLIRDGLLSPNTNGGSA